MSARGPSRADEGGEDDWHRGLGRELGGPSPERLAKVVEAVYGTHFDEQREMLEAAIIGSALRDRPSQIVAAVLADRGRVGPRAVPSTDLPARPPQRHREAEPLYAGSPIALLHQARSAFGAEALALVSAGLGGRRLGDTDA